MITNSKIDMDFVPRKTQSLITKLKQWGLKLVNLYFTIITMMVACWHRAKQKSQQVVVYRWKLLKLFQQLYLIAIIILFVHVPTATIVGLIALLVDFWPRVAKVWNTLLGKAAILLFYAVVTNIMFAYAAGLVNTVTGLDASYFQYTHYTAILLSLPTWFLGISLIALLIFQLLFPFYIAIVVALRLVGVHAKQVFKYLSYPVATMCIRFVFSLLLLVKGLEVYGTVDTFVFEYSSDSEAVASKDSSILDKIQDPETGISLIQIRRSDDISSVGKSYKEKIYELLANFIFAFEANNPSRCHTDQNARSVELNAYQHVEIMEDKSQPYGYKFTVEACESPGIPK